MKNKRLTLLFLLLVAITFMFNSGISIASPYRSYNYDYWGEVTPSPDPYVLDKIIDVNNYATDLRDIFITDDGTIWLADSGKNRIIVLNQEGELIEIIETFTTESGQDKFNSPESVFVNEDGVIFIADTGNLRIVILDENKVLLNVFEFDETQIKEAQVFVEGFRFRPRSIGEGVGNKLYVISAGVYDGIMEFSRDGEFHGFIGAPRVTPSLIEVFWSRLATEEQRARRRLFIPVEFSKLDIDDMGFIYTTVAGTEEEDEAVKRLSPSGKDSLIRAGKKPVIGDIDYPAELDPYSGPSTLIDIVYRKNGIYSVLDSNRGRVFTYDNYGNLLYVFGGPGNYQGMFNRPSAIDSFDDKIFVADRGKNTITVFRPTEYAQAIHQAIEYYENGFYDESAEVWQQVLNLDANYEMAYTGIGRNYLMQEDFETAMVYFRLGEDRENYSKAFEYYRKEVLSRNLNKAISGVLLLVLVLIVLNKLQVPAKVRAQISAALAVEQDSLLGNVKKTINGVLYAKHILFHPFDGFWDLKHEKRGNVASAVVILVLLIISILFNIFYTGFIFNTRDFRTVNLVREILTVVVTFVLWCVVNWGFTTLTDGKGNFRDIFIYSCYALTPLVIILIPITILSNYMVIDEAYFYYLFISIGVIWSMSLLFIGTVMTHDYTVTKAVLTILIITIGIVLVAFVGLLFFMIIDRLILFVMDLYNEIVYRV